DFFARRAQAGDREHQRLSRVSHDAPARSTDRLAPVVARQVRARALPAAQGHQAGGSTRRGAGDENLSAARSRLHENAAGDRLVEHHAPGGISRAGGAEMIATMHVPFVDLRAQHAAIRDEVERAVRALLDRGDFILGAEVERFEAEYAAFIGARHAIGVGTGLSAIELALRAFGVSAGDEVITPANTFIATVLAIMGTGATPVLVDVDPATYAIDPRAISAAVTSRTPTLVPVHLYG